MTQNTKDNAFRDKVVYGVLAALIIFVAQKFMEPLFENREKDKDKTETTAAKISPAKNQVAINKYEAFLTIADKELRKPEPDYSYAKKLYSDAVILAKKHQIDYSEASESIKTVEYRIKKEKETALIQAEPNIPSPKNNETKKQTYPASALANMTFIKGGTFQMGSNDGESNEKPVHSVTLDHYYMGIHEVTFNEYDAYCQAKGIALPKDTGWGRAERPVINVAWYDAVAYCNWRSKEAGLSPVYIINGENVRANFNVKGFRLSTEAEWEYAARSRGKNEKWAGTDSESSLSNYCNYHEDGGSTDSYEYTASVGSFRPNSQGLYDMSGNVWEWCWDRKADYSSRAQTNPKGSSSGQDRVLRGGSWGSDPRYCRVSYRYDDHPTARDINIGFRLVLSSFS